MPQPTDPAVLLRSLPTSASERQLLYARLERLIDEVDPYLDAFSGATVDADRAIDHAQLLAFVQRDRALIETAVLLLSVRLSQLPVRSLYTGTLLVKHCESALGGRSSTYLTELYATATRIDPAAWARLRSSLAILADGGLLSGQRWPLPQLAREACVAVDRVEESWRAAVLELRQRLRGSANRGRRRDPAFRRAVVWQPTIRGLLERLGAPGGPARIVIDYCFMVIAQFIESAQRSAPDNPITRAPADLLILEVFGILAQFSLAKEDLAAGTAHFLEQGDSGRRKRIQRCRLKVLTHWNSLTTGADWADWIERDLIRITAEIEEFGEGGSGPSPSRAPSLSAPPVSAPPPATTRILAAPPVPAPPPVSAEPPASVAPPVPAPPPVSAEPPACAASVSAPPSSAGPPAAPVSAPSVSTEPPVSTAPPTPPAAPAPSVSAPPSATSAAASGPINGTPRVSHLDRLL